MKLRKLKRFWTGLFDRSHNTVYVNENASCQIAPSASMMDSLVRINGESSLVIDEGATIRNTSFQIDAQSKVIVESGASLDNVDVCVWNHSILVIGKDDRVAGVNFVVEKGEVQIAHDNYISNGDRADKPSVIVSEGRLAVGDHNNLKNSFWIRFGGSVSIGKYNCINEGSEIRCDESVTIGSYNMISYHCDIWDTNTHCDYSFEEKKEMYEKDFPRIGLERKKPKTRPIAIGNANWIGKYACVLKGSQIGNEVTIGTRAIVSNVTVEDGMMVVSPKGEAKKLVVN